MDYEDRPLSTAVCLQAKVSERGLGLRRRVNAGPARDAQRRWGGIGVLRRDISEPYVLKVYTYFISYLLG